MADLPPVTARRQRALSIPLRPWLRDHHFDGRAMLPAVVALDLLAAGAAAEFPDLAAGATREAEFLRMLHLPAAARSIPATLEITRHADGSCSAALATEHRSPASGLRRRLVHVTCRFTPAADAPGAPPPAEAPPKALAVPAERVYAELVPFGPSLRNLQGMAHLWRHGALGEAWARPLPDDPDADGASGSPLPLDAAFHLACAWGQRYHGWVAFPVGFAARTVHRPIRSGERCRVWVAPQGADAGGLRFHLRLDDLDGRPCETVRGLRMRALGGGRFQAPAWVRAPGASPGD